MDSSLPPQNVTSPRATLPGNRAKSNATRTVGTVTEEGQLKQICSTENKFYRHKLVYLYSSCYKLLFGLVSVNRDDFFTLYEPALLEATLIRFSNTGLLQ